LGFIEVDAGLEVLGLGTHREFHHLAPHNAVLHFELKFVKLILDMNIFFFMVM
jgi:hypothetical protein